MTEEGPSFTIRRLTPGLTRAAVSEVNLRDVGIFLWDMADTLDLTPGARRLEMPVVQQKGGTDCFAACLTSTLGAIGREANLAEVTNRLRAAGRLVGGGVTPAGAKAALDEAGIRSGTPKFDPLEIARTFIPAVENRRHPILVNLGWQSGGHWVIIIGFEVYQTENSGRRTNLFLMNPLASQFQNIRADRLMHEIAGLTDDGELTATAAAIEVLHELSERRRIKF